MSKSTWWFTWAVASLFAIYFPVAVWLKYSYVPPQGPPGGVLLLVRSFNKFDKAGFAFTSPASKLHQFSDTPDAPERSPILLYEDGKPLGPAHSVHTDVAKYGGGRFSHWTGGFIFSSSDNSDPNLNGREYWAVLPPQ